ncbi:hypothetical protein HYT57_00230 [Candidatus Woesearchaeota archaeon]|nr:hypothetical protein [Candidatus Woesearchaeota archaeon]
MIEEGRVNDFSLLEKLDIALVPTGAIRRYDSWRSVYSLAAERDFSGPIALDAGKLVIWYKLLEPFFS